MLSEMMDIGLVYLIYSHLFLVNAFSTDAAEARPFYLITLPMSCGDIHLTVEEVAASIIFFNTACLAYSLKYLTLQQYKEVYAPKDFAAGVSAGG